MQTGSHDSSTCSLETQTVSQSLLRQRSPSAPIQVRPAVHKDVERFLNSPAELHALTSAFGSPLNVVFPEIFQQNLKAFEETFAHHTLEGFTYFTSKPNKSAAILREASTSSVGVDVSSLESLRSALSHGFHPNRIEATGPKNKDYLTLAIQHGVVLNVDSFEELSLALKLKSVLRTPHPLSVFVRLSGFHSSHTRFATGDSTFGIHVNEAASIFELLENCKREVSLKGFAFHLNTSSVNERLVAVENTLELTLEAVKRGLDPEGINIGGGYRINYAKDPEEWLHFVETLKHSLLTQEESITWNKAGLGFYREGKRIRGAASFMDHVMTQHPADELCSLLTQPLKNLDGLPAGRLLSESMLKLFIEPGRAMLNQLGVTVARVAGNKRSEQGEQLVVLEMNRSNLNATELKLLTDPIHIPKPDRKAKECHNGVFYTGSLCVHNELIQYRKHYPASLPERGDLIVFVNTAPYMMDFVESSTLQQPVARKVAVFSSGEKFEHALDELYQPGVIRSI